MKKTKQSFQWNKVTSLSKYLAMGLFIALPFMGFSLGMKYQKEIGIDTKSSWQPKTISQNPLQPSPAVTTVVKTTPTNKPVRNGASLTDIRYTLPSGWGAEIRDNGLFISPVNDGGYYFIKVYDNDGSMGRREYYCQLTDYCIEETTFTKTNIGNIDGYRATAIDNSGGGAEFFGAKGNKFYIISSYSPPQPNEFDNNGQRVLDSLIF